MTEGNASLFGRFNKLPDMSRADVELLAEDTATYMRLELGFISDQMPEASDLRLGWGCISAPVLSRSNWAKRRRYGIALTTRYLLSRRPVQRFSE